MADLTVDQIKKIVDELAGLRTKLRDNGATALSPTPEWKALWFPGDRYTIQKIKVYRYH